MKLPINMMRQVIKPIARVSNVNLITRPFAAAASGRDPIQQLFLDKIKEYRQKSSSAAGGLVDADESVRKALKEDQERIKRTYNVKDGEESVITAKFTKECALDSPNLKDWK